ncbi:class I SAM-dependent RNA methyltransferase [Maricaulis sp.]|uniref:THUMP domain-containing class I SAM-dependent RNA methyltransferase n=1 Tax=Maricaulis sp. TaxID=1486257 RepID=UPI00260AEA8C|nr:class I SAM-dependent RNA methyltransferase [Maricaulis sp.]
MSTDTEFEIFLATAPGLEKALADEAQATGFTGPQAQPGGVAVRGGWPEVWRANLELRGASRVLARIGEFRVVHLAQLDKRARKIAWGEVLRRDVAIRVEATCRASKIYHQKAVVERIERAVSEELGAPIDRENGLTIRARIDKNVCTLSVDTSGELLHRRGFKEAVSKAPMRENLAALFLRQCGYDGSEPVLDPMCGSGTFVIEAAEIAMGLKPGRERGFAFEQLKTFNPKAWAKLRRAAAGKTEQRFYGSDRDAGAIRASVTNAERAGVGDLCEFAQRPVAELERPEGEPGLVIVNPPYGGRIGNKKALYGVYASLGEALTERFSGWRVGLVTTDQVLAKATRLPFAKPGPPVEHGGLKIRLFQTPPLA